MTNLKFFFLGNGSLFWLDIVHESLVVRNEIKHFDVITDISWSPTLENYFAVCCGAGTISVFNGSQLSKTVKAHTAEISSVSWNPDQILTSSWDGAFKLVK